MHDLPTPDVLCMQPSSKNRGLADLMREAKLTSLQIRKNARELRHNMTFAERLLWQRLRKRQVNGRKFRRQHPIGRFILDFYCYELKFAIELDGNQHYEENQCIHDKQRSEILSNFGIRIIRFNNAEVLNHFDEVMSVINYLTAPTPQPLSQKERG